jgi:hypothetical protein
MRRRYREQQEKARSLSGLFVGRRSCLAGLLLQHGIEHLNHESLLSLGQLRDALELLLQLRRRAAFVGAALGRHADQVFHGDVQGIGQQRQRRNRHAPLAALVGGDRLLRDLEQFGELDPNKGSGSFSGSPRK